MFPSRPLERPRARHRLGGAALAALAVGLSLALTAVVPGRPASAAPHGFGDPIFSTNARGDITTIGNVTTTCDPSYHGGRWSAAASAAACNGARNGSADVRDFAGKAMPPINNRLSMAFVDVDHDPATFDSSTARLTMPAGAKVLWAGLHWNGATSAEVSQRVDGSTFQLAPPSLADRYQVVLRTPGARSYQPLSAAPANGTTTDTCEGAPGDETPTYAGFVDITDAVRAAGSGDYTVGDVQSCRGFGGCFGSWSITVAYAQQDLPARNLEVWHGWQITSPAVHHGDQELTLNGLVPPPSGPVNARIGVVQADGDRGLGPDSLDIRTPSTPWTTFHTADRPLNASEAPDWFNSTTSTLGRRRADADATPNYLANLDQDLALEQTDSVVRNTDTSMSFRIHTAGNEVLFSQVVHSAVEIHQPTIALDKSVTPAGPLHTGDRSTWTLQVRNAGIDPVLGAVVTDPLPAGSAYVPGTIRFRSGGPASLLGAKTDASGDDQADYDPAARTLTFRVGAGADAHAGGTMAVPGADPPDGSEALTITFDTIVQAPPGQTIDNVATAHGHGRALEDGFGPLETTARAQARTATAAVSDLGISKSDGGATIRAVGDRITYQLIASNGGPSPATGVVLTDPLDRRLRFVSSDACSAAGQVVRCAIGDLAAGASKPVTLVVEVTALPAVGASIPNVATISGDQEDPDCTPATPRARCNHDDETTPRVPVPPTTTSTTPTIPPTTAPAVVRHEHTDARPAPPRSVPVVGSLPRTGTEVGAMVLLGTALVGGGVLLVGARRRRQRTT